MAKLSSSWATKIAYLHDIIENDQSQIESEVSRKSLFNTEGFNSYTQNNDSTLGARRLFGKDRISTEPLGRTRKDYAPLSPADTLNINLLASVAEYEVVMSNSQDSASSTSTSTEDSRLSTEISDE